MPLHIYGDHPLTSIYTWSENQSPKIEVKMELLGVSSSLVSIVFVLPPPQALVASWEGHDLARACGIL